MMQNGRARTLFGFFLLAAASSPALANCDTSSLKGLYATETLGAVVGVYDSGGVLHPLASPLPVTGVGQINFDGAGAFTRMDVGINSGVLLGSAMPLTDTGFRTGQLGTYAVDQACTGVLHLSDPGGLEIDFALVLADHGRVATGVVVKQHTPSLPPAIVPTGTTCDASAGCMVGVNLTLDMQQVQPRRR